MIQLGKTQTLKVLKNTSIGSYLGEDNPLTDAFIRKSVGNTASMEVTEILLPKNQIKEPLEIGSSIRVFIYKDSEDRPIATLLEPPLQLGQYAAMKVKDVTSIGAFLDWNLPKDLLLPFKEQTAELKVGDTVLAALYVDKSQRLCATMKLYHYLQKNSPHKKDDHVTGIVYELTDSFGAFVAVDSLYSALIPKKDLHVNLCVNDTIQARIVDVLEDGKLCLSLREKTFLQLDKDGSFILSKLEAAGGALPYHDKSDPNEIKEVFQLSKNAFKKAIGHLMKAGHILIKEDGIELNKKS